MHIQAFQCKQFDCSEEEKANPEEAFVVCVHCKQPIAQPVKLMNL